MKPQLKSKLRQLISKSKEVEKLPLEKVESIPSIQPTIKKSAAPVSTQKPKQQIKESVQKKSVSKFQLKIQKKLAGSKFRWINEQLYTTQSEKSFELFQQQPDLFDVYHEGFKSQVEQWPVNPVDVFIQELRQVKDKVVCDMGCGEAQIAQTLHKQLKIHSFDLVAGNEFITACDIAKVPLPDESVDFVIFCLSLMGTNFVQFLKEARRIIRKSGTLKIAEVVSRMKSPEEFIAGVEAIGFKLKNKDTSNKMFVMMNFIVAEPKKGTIPILKPCIYKRR